VAATLPFVVSILSTFSPSTRVKDIEGYFLFDRELDIDGFLKSTIGYSLQVASITLFFYWTFQSGILGSAVVCLAWASGYWLMSAFVMRGKLNSFLGSGRRDVQTTETIHGFIGARTKTHSGRLRYWAVLAVSLASVIGLGGTMMAEIDYSTQFFMSAAQVTSTELLRVVIEFSVVVFTVLYVLWGGYKSSVFTDRFQTPIAYVAFSVFGFAVAATAKGTTVAGLGLIILVMAMLFAVLLWRRFNTLRRFHDVWGQLTAALTFVPILIFAGAVLVYLSPTWKTPLTTGLWNIHALAPILFPPTSTFLGFGIWGTIALVFANGVWQFIDISSLQRLQSLDKKQVDQHRSNVANAIWNIGLEAGVGWLLISLTAILMRSVALTNDNFISSLLNTRDQAYAFVVPVFVLTVVIYMLSTISGFISALSYISYYDIVPSFLRQSNIISEAAVSSHTRLQAARVTTLFVIGGIFIFYLLLRLVVPGDQIANVLYAIYAFQIAILPNAFVALFFTRLRIDPVASILSVIAGIYIAGVTAINPSYWTILRFVGMDSVSWGVFPPLASALVASATYFVVASIMAPYWAVRSNRAKNETQ
jgi:hypothetical protein